MGKWKPSKTLIDKIKEHNAIVKCPYCKELFDIHAGLTFLEGKQMSPPPKDTIKYFEKVMKAKK